MCVFLFVKLYIDFCLWNLLNIDFSYRETYIFIFLLVKLILFMELVSCWFFSCNLLRADFFVRETCLCWFFTLLNLYISFSPLKTDFVHGTCCILIFVRGTISDFSAKYLLIFYPQIQYLLIFFVKFFACWFFLFAKLVNQFFSSCNYICLFNLLCAYFCSWNFLRANFRLWNLLNFDFSLRETFTL